MIETDTAAPLAGVILGVDLDGVCADFYARMREIAAEWLEQPIESLPLDVSYQLAEWGIRDTDHYSRLHRFAVTQRALFETVPMIRGARRYLRMLSDEGARIRIITHRLYLPYFHRTAAVQTIDWLDSHGIPYWDLCFMKDKEQVGADIYVDDSAANVERLRSRGLLTICFGNSTNRTTGPPRVDEWQEVYELIHAYARDLAQRSRT